ncbi:NHLP bacteriocin export ABC transporter permease/ATPase subunit [Denitratisoma sp. agr-D3]
MSTIILNADQPLALWQADHPWRVEQGFVDLFAVPVHAGRGDGARVFLLRVGPGQVFFPLPLASQDAENVGVIAVGGLACRIAAEAAPAPRDIDAWLQALMVPLQEAPVLRCDRIAAEGSLLLPQDGVLVGSAQRLLWCRVSRGRLRLLDDVDFLREAGSAPLPLGPSLWLQATEEAELELRGSEALGADVVAALADFHGLAAILVQRLVARRRAQQADRLQRRAERSRAALSSGLGQLVDAVLPQARVNLPSAGGDALLQALRRVADNVGVEVREPGLEELRYLRGSRLDILIKASGLRSRGVLLRGDWWRRESGALLGWTQDSRQPVALLPRAGGGYTWWNPATDQGGEVDEVSALALAADGVMLYPRLPDGRLRWRSLLHLGLGASLPDLKGFLVLSLAAALLALLVPVGTGLLVDEIIPAADRGQLAVLVGGLVAAALCTGAFELVKGVALLRIEGRLDAGLQSALFDRLLRLPATFFKQYTAGDLSDRVLGVQAIRQLLAGSSVAALVGGVFSFVSLGVLFAYDVRLALVAVGLTVVSLAVTVALTILQLRHERAQAENRGKVEGLVLQLVTGVTKLKVAAAQDRAVGAWAGHYADQKRRFVRAQKLAADQAVFQALFPPLATVAIFAAVAWLMKSTAAEAALKALVDSEGEVKMLGAGSFLAFQAAYGQFLGAMTHLVQSLTATLGALPLYERAKPILEAPPENQAGRSSPGVLDGAVEFAGVSFAYQADAAPVVQDLSFTLRAGEFAALVGPSGSGKSTVLRLLLGLENPSQGEIFFDGKPASRLNLDALRAQVAVVLQSGRILPGSVLSNIVGQDEASLADAWEAARLVGLDEDIRAMPMGMHTVLMEGGGTLSGGQRQRLMIARALVRKPRILILDEATSALDNRTQAIVTESLKTLNITRLVVAHRLTTIESVDRVLVMSQGRLVESGTVAELRAGSGVFAELARRQVF